VNIKCYYSWEK